MSLHRNHRVLGHPSWMSQMVGLLKLYKFILLKPLKSERLGLRPPFRVIVLWLSFLVAFLICLCSHRRIILKSLRLWLEAFIFRKKVCWLGKIRQRKRKKVGLLLWERKQNSLGLLLTWIFAPTREYLILNLDEPCLGASFFGWLQAIFFATLFFWVFKEFWVPSKPSFP